MKSHPLAALFLSVYMLLALHTAAEFLYWYWLYPWFDLLTHFLGGVCVGLGVLWFFFGSKYSKEYVWTPRKGVAFVLVGIAVVGLAWEAYEVVTHLLFSVPFEKGYVLDSSIDLVMDTLGALTAFALFGKPRRRV